MHTHVLLASLFAGGADAVMRGGVVSFFGEVGSPRPASSVSMAETREVAQKYLDAHKVLQLFEVGRSSRTLLRIPPDLRRAALLPHGRMFPLVCVTVACVAPPPPSPQELSTVLVYHKPANPRAFLLEHLERLKTLRSQRASVRLPFSPFMCVRFRSFGNDCDMPLRLRR